MNRELGQSTVDLFQVFGGEYKVDRFDVLLKMLDFACSRNRNDASMTGMSRSTLNHHFRGLTAMSPLQFQKQLRLHAARQKMLMEELDAASAAFEVGYESPSQFNREYKRFFGQPPMRDIEALRANF